ncbi:alpha-hydroxy-acid oxidizing protein [Vibrio owensii]
MPIALAPVGLTGMYARRGEVQAAKAAEKKGIPFTTSRVHTGQANRRQSDWHCQLFTKDFCF